jgi:hypothetical protein
MMLLLLAATFKYHTAMVLNTEQVVRTKPLMLDSLDKLLQHRVPLTFGTAAEAEIIKTSSDSDVQAIMSLSPNFSVGNWVHPVTGKQLLQQLADMTHAAVTSDQFPYQELVCLLSIIHRVDMIDRKFLNIKMPQVSSPLVGIIMSQDFYEKNKTVSTIISRAIRITSLEADIFETYFLRQSRIVSGLNNFRIEINQCQQIFSKPRPAPILF